MGAVMARSINRTTSRSPRRTDMRRTSIALLGSSLALSFLAAGCSDEPKATAITPIGSDSPTIDPVVTVPGAVDSPEPGQTDPSGGSSSPGNPGTGETVPPSDATVPMPDDSYENGTTVDVVTNANSPHKTTLASLVAVGDEVRVTWWGGVCDKAVSMSFDETDTTVSVDLRVGFDPTVDACIDMARLNRLSVKMSNPLGDRMLVDANAQP